jgi:hypothetical protein
MGCQNLYSLGSRRESHPLCWPGSRLNYSDLEMRTQTITTHCGYVAVVHAKLNQGGTVFRFRSRGMSPDTYSNTRSVRPSAIRSSNVCSSKIPGTRTLGILLWKKNTSGRFKRSLVGEPSTTGLRFGHYGVVDFAERKCRISRITRSP